MKKDYKSWVSFESLSQSYLQVFFLEFHQTNRDQKFRRKKIFNQHLNRRQRIFVFLKKRRFDQTSHPSSKLKKVELRFYQQVWNKTGIFEKTSD